MQLKIINIWKKLRGPLSLTQMRRHNKLPCDQSMTTDAPLKGSLSFKTGAIPKQRLLEECDVDSLVDLNGVDSEVYIEGTQPCSSRPSFVTVLIIFLCFIVFVILPCMYLLHCFDLLRLRHEHEVEKVIMDHSHFRPWLDMHKEVNPHVDLSFQHNGTENLSTAHKKINAHGTRDKFLSYLELPQRVTTDQCQDIPDDRKFDCYPEDGANRDLCKARGCCWKERGKVSQLELSVYNESEELGPSAVPLDVPYCYYPMNYGGYHVMNISEVSYGLQIYLMREFASGYANDIQILRMDVSYETEDRLHIKIYDPVTKRYEAPIPVVPKITHAATKRNYYFNIDKASAGFQVVRSPAGEIIFDSRNVGAFIFANQFLQLSSVLPSKYIFGLGEHRDSLLHSMNWHRFTMFNADKEPEERANLYGSHPMYLVMEETHKSQSHGVFLKNSNAMDVILQPGPAITFRTIGGIIDLYFFLGPSPADVIRQYTDLIGRPFMPPYWSLGFHLCRFGYNSLNNTKEVWNRTRQAGIPFDVQWNDIDYMDQRKDFTISKKYKRLPEFIQHLHSVGMHYIPIIDPSISNVEPKGSYPPYDEGLEAGIFIKNSSGLPFVGKVWNAGSCVWPDFTHPQATEYWTKQMQRYHNEVSFDGAWIDMNEPSNFWNGGRDGCSASKLNHPPYIPAVQGDSLFYKTVCMSARQHAGYHYDVHNLYGTTETIATNVALRNIRKKRPFIISRSTFSGQGHFGGHWTGDIASTWYDMKKTVPGILNFNLFGIPMVGADICGFNGNTTAALCQRWMELGAFYPFSRNHNTDTGIAQDPVALGPAVVEASKKALTIRYSLLPYLYTLFWRAHAYGDTVARPLFFVFPEDKVTYSVDTQFMWGSALMIIPVLEENKTDVEGYLPVGVWYDFYTHQNISSEGGWHTFHAPYEIIPLVVKGGSIIPMQIPGMTTTESRKNDFELLVALDDQGEAFGQLYWDDGDTLNTWEDGHFNLVNFVSKKQHLTSVTESWRYRDTMTLGMMMVMGVAGPVNLVTIDDVKHSFSYDAATKVLQLQNLTLQMNEPFIMKWE